MFYTSASIQRNGNRWRAFLNYQDGEMRRKISKTLEATGKREARREADQWLAEENKRMERDAKRGALAVKGGKQLVTAYVAEFIDIQERAKAIQPSTIRGYRGSLKYIERGFKGVKMEDLAPEMIREWEAELTEMGYSSSTVGKAHRLLKQVCTFAAGNKVIDEVPFFQVKPPRRENKKKGINALDRDARHALIERLEMMDLTRTTVSAYIALWTGLRRGEVCALQWRDYDEQAKTLKVRQAIGEGKGGDYVKDPKTHKERTLSIGPTLAGILARWKVVQRDQFAECMATLTRDSYIVGDAEGFYSPTYLSREWAALTRAFGIKGTEGRLPTFHDLRHSYATTGIAGGIDPVTVANGLGHSKPSMTLDVYAALDPNAQRESAKRFEELM